VRGIGKTLRIIISSACCLQCFDTYGWARGMASILSKTSASKPLRIVVNEIGWGTAQRTLWATPPAYFKKKG